MMTGLDNRGPGTLDIRGKAPVDPPLSASRSLKPDGSKENRT